MKRQIISKNLLLFFIGLTAILFSVLVVFGLITSQKAFGQENNLDIPEFFTFELNMELGLERRDVGYLQRLLNFDHDTALDAEAGQPGSPGYETNRFGPLTEGAVRKFQSKYFDEILVPAGVSSPNGYVGPFTRNKLNSILFELRDQKPEIDPDALHLSFISPTTGGNVVAQETHTIEWQPTNLVGGNLQLFVRHEGGEYTRLRSFDVDVSSFEWEVPNRLGTATLFIGNSINFQTWEVTDVVTFNIVESDDSGGGNGENGNGNEEIDDLELRVELSGGEEEGGVMVFTTQNIIGIRLEIQNNTNNLRLLNFPTGCQGHYLIKKDGEVIFDVMDNSVCNQAPSVMLIASNSVNASVFNHNLINNELESGEYTIEGYVHNMKAEARFLVREVGLEDDEEEEENGDGNNESSAKGFGGLVSPFPPNVLPCIYPFTGFRFMVLEGIEIPRFYVVRAENILGNVNLGSIPVPFHVLGTWDGTETCATAIVDGDFEFFSGRKVKQMGIGF